MRVACCWEEAGFWNRQINLVLIVAVVFFPNKWNNFLCCHLKHFLKERFPSFLFEEHLSRMKGWKSSEVFSRNWHVVLTIILDLSLNVFWSISSEGGTGENWRIDPYLNLGFLLKTIVIFGKNWFRSSPRIKKISDPHLDEIRSTLTEHKHNFQTKKKSIKFGLDSIYGACISGVQFTSSYK